MMLSLGVLRAGGDNKYCLFTDTLGMWLIGIPLTWFVADEISFALGGYHHIQRRTVQEWSIFLAFIQSQMAEEYGGNLST